MVKLNNISLQCVLTGRRDWYQDQFSLSRRAIYIGWGVLAWLMSFIYVSTKSVKETFTCKYGGNDWVWDRLTYPPLHKRLEMRYSVEDDLERSSGKEEQAAHGYDSGS